MAERVNAWVSGLLSWHGQDRGGVSVPFQRHMGKPLGRLVETPLLQRMRGLARDLAAGVRRYPRWIFLVGGPGNGKSQAVEEFVRELDHALDMGGTLITVVSSKFTPSPVTRRRVEVTPGELGAHSGRFQQTVRRLVLVQDASAVDSPVGAAEQHAIEDVVELVTSPHDEEPVFICCANRGLLARALTALQKGSEWNVPEVRKPLRMIAEATAHVPSASGGSLPSCWPLEGDGRFACWPLDMETLLAGGGSACPIEQLMLEAIDERLWEASECGGCKSISLCPFLYNARQLRDPSARGNLLRLLRHGELATGQRWNFRDAFSLCAELLVGQQEDFEGTGAPCLWVHDRVWEALNRSQPVGKVGAAWGLASRVYYHALFPRWLFPEELAGPRVLSRGPVTAALVEAVAERKRGPTKHIRCFLEGRFSECLDPALATPVHRDSLLRAVEDEFAQSVDQGLGRFRSYVSPAEVALLELMAVAEREWTGDARDPARAKELVQAVRWLAATLVKRAVGVQCAEYLNADRLAEYEGLLSHPDKLSDMVPALRGLLAPGGMFAGSLVRTFGQPDLGRDRDVMVTGPLGSVLPRPAPRSTESRSGHDVPFMEVRTGCIPLSFEMFLALKMYESGLSVGCLPPHTRAALDRVRSTIAGHLARDRDGMEGREVIIEVGSLGRLVRAGGMYQLH